MNATAFLTIVVLLISGVFVFDTLMPLGLAVGILYLPPLLLSLRWLKPTTTVLLTAICSALILTELMFMENALVPVGIALLNRFLAVGVICITIFLGLRYKTAMDKIQRLADNLDLQTAELEAANQDLEAFSYSVAHDLRKPLSIIIGYCEMIQEQCAGKLDAQCREFLKEINDGTDKMGKTIDVLLEFALFARCPITKEMIDLSEIARDIAASLQLTQPERAVTFVVADGLTASADSRLMRVVLENLLGNAWKYTAQKPEAIIEFGVDKTAGRKIFFVKDNGIGFDQEQAESVFGAFQRLHSGYEGFGIGLATVKRIIDRHGGNIWAQGVVGTGAAFHFAVDGQSSHDRLLRNREVASAQRGRRIDDQQEASPLKKSPDA